MPLPRHFLALVVLVLSYTVAQAQITLEATPGQSRVTNLAPNVYRSTLSAISGDSLVADFGALGNTGLTYNTVAPIGQLFEITTGADWNDITLNIVYENGGADQATGSFEDTSALVFFNEFPNFNPIPTNYSENSIYLSGPGGSFNQATFRVNLAANATYRFNLFSILTEVPSGYDVNVSSTFGRAQIFVDATSPSFGGSAPSSFLTLQPIPEPATTGLLLLGLGALALRRRPR